ncbi:MAG: rRNA maturation RNase YbeY [Halioglobus sp.]|nr:rRNA maturation RNase YbeY [Halioglobus sp.]
MSHTVDIQCASAEPVPEEDDIRRWVDAALAERGPGRDCEISVRLVDTEEMALLNKSYRGKTGATNVLSFPAALPEELEQPLLGDIVICAPVVRREARQQNKALQAHWAHMTVHGTLHLLGYDHVDETEAGIMEALETHILAQLDYPCPYGESPHGEQATP